MILSKDLLQNNFDDLGKFFNCHVYFVTNPDPYVVKLGSLR